MADGYVSQVQLPNNETYDIKDKNAVKDITSSDIPGNINFTKGEETKDILVKDFGTAYGIDCYKGRFPLDFTSPSGAIDEWKIYGNSSGPTEVLETQSTLPVGIDTYGGNAVDWEIYGNNNPIVENKTGDLPIEVSATAGNAVDYIIYGNAVGVGENTEITRELPIDFRSNGDDLLGYRIYGTADGAGVQTENLMQVIATSKKQNGITFTVDGACRIIINGTATANVSFYIDWVFDKASAVNDVEPSTTYTVSGGLNTTGVMFYWGTFNSDGTHTQSTVSTSATFTTDATAEKSRAFIYVTSGTVCNNLVCKPMLVKGSTLPKTHIPYGYKLPLTVTSGTESKDTDIYIGDSKLLSGDYVDYEAGKIYKAKRIHEDTVTIDGIEWDILDYDHDEVYKADGTRAKHTVTIQTHDIIDILQYSARQAAFAFPDGLAAGAYKFTVGAHPWVAGDINKVLTFTLVNAIPAGGQLVFNGAHDKTLVGKTISVFASPTSTTAAETVTMTEGDTGTDLGTMLRSKTDTVNSIDRAMRGSNNWLESAMRQYLNSDKAAGSVWSPQTVFDRPPAWAESTAGFLHGIDPDFVAMLGNVKKTTGLNNISDGGGTAVHDEKFFLLSRSEVYMGDEYTGGEDTPYAYYKNYSDYQTPSTSADKNRIKYRAGVANNWWLRSPTASDAYHVRHVGTSGAWNSHVATNAYGVAPACCIVLDDMDDWVKQTFYTKVDADLSAIETFSGENTIDSTVEVGETMITQGYRIPLQIKQGTTTKTADIYIGSSPLTQGQTITKSQSNVDLELFSGDNIIDTTLVNKPQVDLTYLSSVLGVGERTGNLFDISAVVDGYINAYGVLTAGTPIQVEKSSDYIEIDGSTAYTISAVGGFPSLTGYQGWRSIAYYDSNKSFLSRTASEGTSDLSATSGSTAKYVRISYRSFGVANLQIMLVKGSTAPSTYIPHGYQIPISVTSGQQSTPYNFYIGSAPLTEGQSVTKASSDTDIALYQGENTISTTLGNKPEMRIDYLSTVVGVGERTKNKLPAPVNGTYTNNRATVTVTNGVYRIEHTVEGSGSSSVFIDIPEFEVPDSGYINYLNSAACSGVAVVLRYKGASLSNGYALIPINRRVAIGSDYAGKRVNQMQIYVSAGSGNIDFTMSPMITDSDTYTAYIPYGYQIPIDIKQDDEVVDHKDIYIGTQPLVEGDYINQTGVYRRLHQFVNYASSSSLPNYNFIPITEQLIAGNGENTITTSLVNNTTIDVELHPTKQASWICDRLEDLQRRIDNVDSTLGAPERRNYLVTWCSEDRLTGSTANLDFSFNNKDSGYSTFLIDGKSTATSAFTETINLLHMINGTVQYDGSNNYTVARPGKYVIVIFGVEMEDSSSNTITLKIIRDNVVIASQQLINEYIGCIPFEIPNDIFGNNTIIQIEVNSTTGWTDLSFGAGIAVLNATMLLQDSNLKTDTMAIGNFSMYDSYVQLLRSHRSLESKCTILENKCTVLENEYDQLANESVKDIIVYSDHTTTIPSGLNIDISQYKNKIKYVDIYFTDNNYRKGEVYPYNILAENFGYLRIPYGQIYTGASADEATRLSLSLIGDENTYYIRRELFYVSTDYEQEHLFFSQYSSVPGLILQFVGTPTNEWSDFSVKGKASEVIKIYEVHLIVSP